MQRPSWLLLSSWVKAANSQVERSLFCFSRASESTIRGQEVNFDPEIKLCSITLSSQVLWVTGAALYMLVPWTRSVAWCIYAQFGTNAIERACLVVFSCTYRSVAKKGGKAGLEQSMTWGFVILLPLYQYVLQQVRDEVKPGLLVWKALCNVGSDSRCFPKSELKYDRMSKVPDSVQAWDGCPLSRAYQVPNLSLPDDHKATHCFKQRPVQGWWRAAQFMAMMIQWVLPPNQPSNQLQLYC